MQSAVCMRSVIRVFSRPTVCVCRWPRFCSAFLDTDAPFGSLGSFFKLQPEQGSFEANPPFDDDVISQMAAHMDALLSRAENSHKFAPSPHLASRLGRSHTLVLELVLVLALVF